MQAETVVFQTATKPARKPLALMRVDMNKTIKILILSLVLIRQKSFAQNDSVHFENVRQFFNCYVNFSEQNPNEKNDTIINLFFIRDTIEARLKEGLAIFGCARYNLNNLPLRYQNSFNFSVDSVFKNHNENKTFYLRLKSANNCALNTKRPAYYEFYKIVFTRERYYIIPGHGNEDVCFSAIWAFNSCYNNR